MDEVKGITLSLQDGVTLPSGVLTRVLGPYKLLSYPRKSFTIRNLSFLTLSGGLIQTNPDSGGDETGASFTDPVKIAAGPNSAMWETYDSISLQNLVGSGIKTVHISTATAKWWRVAAINNAVDGISITVSGYCHATAI